MTTTTDRPTTRDEVRAAWIAYHAAGGKLTYTEFAANHGLFV